MSTYFQEDEVERTPEGFFYLKTLRHGGQRRIQVTNFLFELVETPWGDDGYQFFDVRITLGGEVHMLRRLRARTLLSPSGFWFAIFRRIAVLRVQPIIKGRYWPYVLGFMSNEYRRSRKEGQGGDE